MMTNQQHRYTLGDGRQLLTFVQQIQRRLDELSKGLSYADPKAAKGVDAAQLAILDVVRAWAAASPGDEVGTCGFDEVAHYAGLCPCHLRTSSEVCDSSDIDREDDFSLCGG